MKKLFWFILGALAGEKRRRGRIFFWDGRMAWFDTTREVVDKMFGPGKEHFEGKPYSCYVIKAATFHDPKHPRFFYAAFPGGAGEYDRGGTFEIEKSLALGHHPWRGVLSAWWRLWKVLPA